MKIHIGIIDHKHGRNVYAARSREDLEAKVATYCRRYWDDDTMTWPGILMHHKIIATYFEAMSESGNEYYEHIEVDL